MFCGECGNKMSDSAKFCTKCGWKAPERTNSEIQGNVSTSVATETQMMEPVADVPKKKSKAWLWILLIVLVLGLGATATLLCLEYINSEEDDDREDDEDEDDDRDDDDRDKDDEDEDDDRDSDEDDDDEPKGAYGKYVDKSEKTATVQMIWTTMNAFEVLAADPGLDWETGEVIYVRFTEDGIEYGSDNEEVISQMKAIMGDNTAVKQWLGYEMWAKKSEYGIVQFATSWDYDEMAEISPSFADKFSMTSVQP